VLTNIAAFLCKTYKNGLDVIRDLCCSK